LESHPLVFPQKLHFSCHMCSGCCRNWNVLATPAEVERFRNFDWRATRPRFDGREILSDAGNGLYQLAHIEDACIFLDEDNLCAIHKELGADAKPFMCKTFPYSLTKTPEGVVVSLDFACPTVVADEGAPIQSHAADVRARVEEWGEVGAHLRLGMAGATLGGEAPRVEARKGAPLEWADYMALEQGFFRLLKNEEHTLTERLQLVDALATEAGAHSAPGEMGGWVDSLADVAWAPLRTSSSRVSPLGQRALVAPVVASIEEGWGEQLGGAKRSGAARVRLALALTASSSSITLPTGDGATLQLPRMLRTRFAQDDPDLNAPIERFLTAFIVRKGLLKGTTLLQGSRYLALYFAVLRWYSVARAVLAEREAVEPADVRYALILVEKTLSRSPGLNDARFTALMNFLFDRVTPARSLYRSTYPS
jgi:Fe-S-cluster containining protein